MVFPKHDGMRRENRERENSCKLSVTSLVGGWAINRMEQQCKSCFVKVLVASKLDLPLNVMVDPDPPLCCHDDGGERGLHPHPVFDTRI